MNFYLANVVFMNKHGLRTDPLPYMIKADDSEMAIELLHARLTAEGWLQNGERYEPNLVETIGY